MGVPCVPIPILFSRKQGRGGTGEGERERAEDLVVFVCRGRRTAYSLSSVMVCVLLTIKSRETTFDWIDIFNDD